MTTIDKNKWVNFDHYLGKYALIDISEETQATQRKPDMKTTIKKPKKLTPVESIEGMWNGYVWFNVQHFGEIQTRIHVGLKDSNRIKKWESAEKVVSEIIAEHQGYKVTSIAGVKSDRKMKEVLDPFSR